MNQRIEAIDAVRGFSLFGILLVNMPLFQYGMFGIEKIPYIFEPFDQFTNSFINFFGTGNFVALFSFLFGFSIIMLQNSVIKKERPFFPIYTRRITLLLAIGLLHLTFIWDGDILFSYGVIGVLLMMFINRKPKTLLIWTIILLGLMMLITYPSESSSGDVVDFGTYMKKEQHIHETGSYIDHVTFRMTENPFGGTDFAGHYTVVLFSILMGLYLLPTFLFGMYVAKKGWLFQIEEHIPFIKKVCITTGVFSFSVKLIALVTEQPIAVMLKDSVSHLAMALFYASSIILLVHAKKAPRLFKYMANMGKMSVSNYLMQSIIATTIFYAYGFGLFGKIGLFFGLVLTVIIYTIQLFASTYWLQRLRMGPVEYVWRLWTYWERPTFKQSKKAS